eukprot:6139825-Karenia_brevis.AAC.1
MDPTTDFQRSAVVRDAALKAHLKASDTAALQRAALGRSRLPPKSLSRKATLSMFCATMSSGTSMS